MSTRSIIKKSLANILYYSGVLTSYARTRFDNKGFVLMYHRIIDELEKVPFPIQPGMYVSKASFELQMSFLKRHFHIISLEDMISKLDAGKKITRCCSVTFDDGWKDNYDAAFPILARHGIPATIFLATGYIGTEKWFWPEEVAWCLSILATRNMLSELPDLAGVALPRLGTIELIVDSVIERLKMYHPQEREDFVSRIRSLSPERPRDRLMMNWAEAKAMMDSGIVNFGSHTAEHKLLHQIRQKDIDWEITTSREDIKRNLGIDTTLFAYPNGEFNQTIKMVLKEYGFSGAVTTKRGYVCHATPRLEISRIGIHDDISNTRPLFYSRVLLNAY